MCQHYNSTIMKKVIIIDDESLAREVIRHYLKDNPEIEIVTECSNGFDGLKAIQEHQPDILFLDVQMPKINGFEMLELVDNPPQVIFTTAFDEYALKAFDANAIDYLLKPFTRERFDTALQKAISSERSPEVIKKAQENESFQPDENIRVVIQNGSEIKIIPTEEIIFVEAADDYVCIHTKEKRFLKKKTMQYFEKVLDTSKFLRIHRSFILNLTELTRIESFEKNSHIAILRSGHRLPISRNQYPVLKNRLGI